MPWESRKCELPLIQLAEVASPVVSLLAQPHRLEIFVRRRRDPLIYFPDLELTVEASIFETLTNTDVPFGRALLEWRPERGRQLGHRKIVVEVKDDDDPRNNDPDYQRKLSLAKRVYAGLGMGFLVVQRSRDLACVDLDLIQHVALCNYVEVSTADEYACTRWLSDRSGTGRLGDLAAQLGGGLTGRDKAAALLVRRVISIDLARGLLPSTPVTLLHTPVQPAQSKGA